MEYFTLIPFTTDITYLIVKLAVLLAVLLVWMIVMTHPAY
jgi:hypothetical protein